MPKRFETSFYTIKKSNLTPQRIAVVADLHTDIPPTLLDTLKNLLPDLILLPGDTFERLDGSKDEQNLQSYDFLEKAATLAPTFFSLGNHEVGGIASWNTLKWYKIKSIPKYISPLNAEKISGLDAKFIDDSYVIHNRIAIGGLASGLINPNQLPALSWIDEFCALSEPKILLCHHPEYYPKYLKNLPIDLIVCGHAHGGQWRIFGRGVFAPGQGIFPKYTSGVHDNKCVISRGLMKIGYIPRILNTPELVIIDIVN